jgi:hypothetical protein
VELNPPMTGNHLQQAMLSPPPRVGLDAHLHRRSKQSKSVCVEATFARRPLRFDCREIKRRRHRGATCSGALSLFLSRFQSRPAFVFIVFSLAFGSAISVFVPPLRGPDEIAHFLRIYSYTRGGFLEPISKSPE